MCIHHVQEELLSASSMCPLWQVSFGNAPSNGSLHEAQHSATQNVVWMDMAIHSQIECERCLQKKLDFSFSSWSPRLWEKNTYANDEFMF